MFFFIVVTLKGEHRSFNLSKGYFCVSLSYLSNIKSYSRETQILRPV